MLRFNDDYRCKLSTRALVECENLLGDNPINILEDMGEKLPKLDTLLTILWCSMMDYNHSIKKSEIYSIFDSYIAAGHNILDLAAFIFDLFVDSGMIAVPEEESEEKTEGDQKN